MNLLKNKVRYSAFVALLLALVLCFTACGGNEKETSSNPSAISMENTTENAVSDTEQQEEKTSSKTSNKQTTSKKQTATSKAVWADDYLATMPKTVKEKGIKFLLWRELHPTEQKLLDDFTKKTGCQVKKIITTEAEYNTKLLSMITSKNSPDVVMLGSDSFPSNVIKAIQPIDEKLFRLQDSCWAKDYMDSFKINGKYYSVAMEKTWSCTDVHYVTYYQTNVLKDAGIKTMPYELWKQGKWNWQAQRDMALKLGASNRGYAAISLSSYDIPMLASGCDFTEYDGKNKFKTAIDASANSALLQTWQYVAKLREENLLTDWSLNSVLNGKVGLFTSIAYGMYTESDWEFDELPDGGKSLEAVPVAAKSQSSAYTPYRSKTWGVAKGAKNVEGAAYFLRYFLDYKNTDWDSTFLNDQCREVFEYITKPGIKRKIRSSVGVLNHVQSDTHYNIIYALTTATSANVASVLNSKSGQINSAINLVNRELGYMK